MYSLFRWFAKKALIKQYIWNILKHTRSATATRAALQTATAKGVASEKTTNSAAERRVCCLHEALTGNEPQNRCESLQVASGKRVGESAGVWVRAATLAAVFVFVFVIAYWPSLWATQKHWLILLLFLVLRVLSCYFPLDLFERSKLGNNILTAQDQV